MQIGSPPRPPRSKRAGLRARGGRELDAGRAVGAGRDLLDLRLDRVVERVEELGGVDGVGGGLDHRLGELGRALAAALEALVDRDARDAELAPRAGGPRRSRPASRPGSG